MTEPGTPAPHPDFDGHLEVPFEAMTAAQRLDWVWQMHVLQATARRRPKDTSDPRPPAGPDKPGQA